MQATLDRLSSDNLQESTVALAGQFEGVLPRRKTFEFRRLDTGEVISGKIAAAVEAPESINDHLYRPVTVQFVETTVGHGKPRYLITELPQAWSGGGSAER